MSATRAMIGLVDPFLPDEQKVAAIRELLPATGAGVYLDTASAGPFPAETHQALAESDDWELRVGRVAPDRSEEIEQRAGEAQSVVAAVIGVAPAEIVLTTGPGSALLTMISTLPPRDRGRVVVVGELQPALDASLKALVSVRGWTLDRAHAGTAPDADALLTVVSTIDAGTGERLDAQAVVDRASAAGSAVLVDASLSAGALELAPRALGATGLLIDGHRWLLGPEGVTALWLDPSHGQRLEWGIVDLPTRRQLVGLARSVGWLLMYVGLPWAIDRTAALAGRLARSLAGLEGVELPVAPDRLGPVVPFRLRGWTADEAADELGRRVFAIVGRDLARGMVRASVGAWNREDELDRFAQAVAELARHTPATLPRRPPLVVLGADR
jgi:selenocysteine lyase/cysteine desulfurase